MQFKDKLKRLREAKGLTQADIAKRINTSAKTVSSWEIGHRTPQLKTVMQLADIFDVEWEKLLDDEILEFKPKGEYILSMEEQHLIKNFRELNQEGQEMVSEYVEVFVASGRYKKRDTTEMVD